MSIRFHLYDQIKHTTNFFLNIFYLFDSFAWIDGLKNVVLKSKLHRLQKYAFRSWFLCFSYVFVFLTVKLLRWTKCQLLNHT